MRDPYALVSYSFTISSALQGVMHLIYGPFHLPYRAWLLWLLTFRPSCTLVMSIQKADQIASRVYTNLAAVPNNARAILDPKYHLKLADQSCSSPPSLFNFETNDSDIVEQHLRVYHSVPAAPALAREPCPSPRSTRFQP